MPFFRDSLKNKTMKLNNKFINGIFIAMLLPFLFGCEKSEAVFAYAKTIGIHYVDNEGNILYFDKDGKISLHDFVELDLKLRNCY